MTKFQHVTDIGEKLFISSLEDNIKSFLDWGFLNIGGFVNVTIPTSGVSGGDFHKLRSKNSTNTLWEASRKDWVYESGIQYSGNNPVNISGIYINNSFVPGPTGLAPNSYKINYPMGQILFDTPKPANTNITLNYSYRYVQVYKTNEAVWWKEIQKQTYDPLSSSDGDADIFAKHRVQLPAIVIETIARNYQTPYQLGTTENIITQDIFLHVFAENPTHRASIIDILLLQKDKQSFLYNLNKLIRDNRYPINIFGQKNSNGLNYDQIINNQNYHLNSYYIDNAIISELNTSSSSLYSGIIRWTIKIFP